MICYNRYRGYSITTAKIAFAISFETDSIAQKRKINNKKVCDLIMESLSV